MFCHIKTRKPMLHIPLSSLDHSAQLDVTVAVGTYSNSWRIFVFADAPASELPMVHSPAELDEICRIGGRALVPRELFPEQIPCNFIPVFWSPVFFPSKASCGVMINAAHPALQDFPPKPMPITSGRGFWRMRLRFVSPKTTRLSSPFLKMSRIFTTTPPPHRWP